MGFYTGTLTGGGTSGLISKIEECLTAESANWEFVEEYVFSTKTYRIWKNKGHIWNNNVPFYLLIHAYSTTSVNIRLCEEWDSVNKKAIGITMSAGTGSVTVDSLGRLASTDPVSAYNGAISVSSLPTTATVYTYYIAVHPHGLFLATSTAQDAGYVGLFEPSGIFSTGEFPLCTEMHSGTGARLWYTRLPGLTGSLNYTAFEGTVENNAYGSIPTGISQLGGKSILSRRRYIQPTSILRGYGPAWYLYSANPTAGVVSGDTITINGVTYTYVKTQGLTVLNNWISA